MAEIVEFKSREKLINKEVIETLEHYLEKAKNGEIIAAGIAAVMHDGTMYTTTCRSDCFPSLVGAISQLLHRALYTANVSSD